MLTAQFQKSQNSLKLCFCQFEHFENVCGSFYYLQLLFSDIVYYLCAPTTHLAQHLGNREHLSSISKVKRPYSGRGIDLHAPLNGIYHWTKWYFRIYFYNNEQAINHISFTKLVL